MAAIEAAFELAAMRAMYSVALTQTVLAGRLLCFVLVAFDGMFVGMK